MFHYCSIAVGGSKMSEHLNPLFLPCPEHQRHQPQSILVSWRLRISSSESVWGKMRRVKNHWWWEGKPLDAPAKKKTLIHEARVAPSHSPGIRRWAVAPSWARLTWGTWGNLQKHGGWKLAKVGPSSRSGGLNGQSSYKWRLESNDV